MGAFGVWVFMVISAERVSLCSNARDPFSTAPQPLRSSWAVWQSFLSTKPSLPLSWRRLCSLSAAFCSLRVSLHSWGALPGMPGCVPGLHPANRGWEGAGCLAPCSPQPQGRVVQDTFPTAPNSPHPGYAVSSTGGVRLSLGTARWFGFGFGRSSSLPGAALGVISSTEGGFVFSQ